jgi:hypothetical protein
MDGQQQRIENHNLSESILRLKSSREEIVGVMPVQPAAGLCLLLCSRHKTEKNLSVSTAYLNL